MKDGSLSAAEKYTSAHRRRRLWYRVVTCLACVVVFCTVYALILPAITLENTGCEIPEHTHTQTCYTQVTAVQKTVPVCSGETLNIHRHTQDCYDGEGDPTCGKADFVVHHHDASCYDENGKLWCPLPEIEAHQHTESCYAQPEVHTHTDGCYTRERGELICTEHVHTDECYQQVQDLVCGLEESEDHCHDDSCYETRRELVCGSAGDHQHTDECYTWNEVLTCDLSTEADEEAGPVLVCGKTEIVLHRHTADCYDGNGTLTCGKPEVQAHQHTDACFETVTEPVDTEALTCTLSEDENHTHTALCYGTWKLTCGMEEHTHTEDCAGDPEADVETQEEWERTFAEVRSTGDWRQDVMAIAKTQLDYTESIRNYVVREDGTRHGYTRYGDWYGSPYGDWCAMFVSFCIHYADVEEMPLNSDCGLWITELEDLERYRAADSGYTPEAGDLIFFDLEQDGLSDRVGLVAELVPASGEEPAKITDIEGDSDGQVRYVTRDLDDPAILGYGLLPEQTFCCGKTGHVHTEDCGGEGVCPLEEHIHTDSCLTSAEEEAPTELSFEGPDYTVTVRYGADAALPEGVELVAVEIPVDSEEYQTYYAQAAAFMEGEQTVVFARFFDISFQLDGVKYEPAAPVSVTITYAEAVETGEDADCQAIHFTDEGTEVLDATAEQREDGSTSFTHIQEGFSVVGTVVALPADYNSTDVGPDSLPVDYYVCIDGEWVCVGSTKKGWYGTRQDAETLNDYNRDYITVAQAASILGKYGFTGTESNPSRVTAYQQKSGHTLIYSDTNTVTVAEGTDSGTKILPLSINGDHAGYNLYYLPNNSVTISAITSPENLDKSANGFYTVKVYDAQGKLLTSEIVKTGGSFTYNATASGVTNWLAAYGSGSTGTINGGNITIDNITSPVTVAPNPGVAAGSHSVTFKVMIDGQWKTVGSLPYYYSGTFNGSQRAYITSAMAAQMFGDYGYTATTAPGYQFGYSYNDIYTLFYANGSTRTNFCMDVAGGTLQEAQVVQLYTSNGSDAQVFRVWDAGGVYSFITPIRDSGFHVNVYGYETGDPSTTQLKLSTATNANSQWKVDTGSDGRTTFWSAIAPNDQVIDLNNNQIVDAGRLQVWHSTGGARYWYMVQQYRISNNTASERNADGTYNIGLTQESNGDIVCYYMPAETSSHYTNVSESAVDTANSFWSVSVRDDTHSVYSDGELSHMVTIVKTGEGATVTVRNADGILWSCTGAANVTAEQSGGNTTFTIRNITGPVEVVATKADPTFKVQYYANINRYVLGDIGNLDIINTSGKKLPTNSGSQTLLWLTLEDTGTTTNQNHGNATHLQRVKSEKQLTQMYTDGTYNFEQHPGLEYFDKLWEQSNYKLDAVLVLKDGKSPDSTNDDDWWWYQVNQNTWDNITFTNLASEEKAPRQEGVKQGRDGTYCILLEEGTVLRLRYETSSQSYTNQANFHDYDITSGQNSDGTWRSGNTGINKYVNYQLSGNGQYQYKGSHDAGATENAFAFGNVNCATGLGLAQWKGNNLNAYNGANVWISDDTKEYFGNGVYKGCTFGLITGLDGNGNLIWEENITAQHLFTDGTAEGKHSYNNGSLQFNQTGDTYTLTEANSSVGSRDNLEYFFNPSPSSSTTHTHIFTNNFWPMDSATNKTDPLMGAINSSGTCDVKVNGFWNLQNTIGGSHNGVRVPISDDGRAHNWFFGMNFSLSFTLTEDYLGPLEYIFFGDDDMWVFLDNQLICDIGGVHSSVGEYVNLRDYLPNGSSGQHTLSFFYTERGASGSTCWMSFTLPSVTSATTGQDIGSLAIAKSLEGTGDVDFSGEAYKFKVELLTSENGSGLNRTFSYQRSDGTYGTIQNGGTITLHQNETATINGIPAGTFYRVTELTTEGYHTTVNGNEGYIVSGTISNGGEEPASFVNRPYTELPSTGGSGTYLYTIGGLLLMAAAAYLLLYSHTKRRKEDAPSS